MHLWNELFYLFLKGVCFSVIGEEILSFKVDQDIKDVTFGSTLFISGWYI